MKKRGKDYYFAVIDAGKTNKKVSIYSKNLKLITKDSTQIGEIKIDGILCDDIPEMNSWILRKLKEFAPDYSIKAISATTFGATVVLLDKSGEMCLPVISYMNPVGKNTVNKFLKSHGSKLDLYLKTGTPLFGQSLNVAIQLFWLKDKKRQEFNRIKDILFLPQYIGYVLTGKKSVELTSIGCHTFLYDFKKKGWSSVAKEMKVIGKIPSKVSKPWDVAGTIKAQLRWATGLDKDCQVAVGIHDSNSSLLPYLISYRGDFILASTGTWGVFMYPGADYKLEEESLRKDVLYYIDPLGRPVKASRFGCGMEHDHYSSLIEKHFGSDPKKIELNINLLEDILDSCDCFVIPTLTPDTGQFPDSKPMIVGKDKFFRDIDTAYHVLCLSLAIQSYFAIKEIMDTGKNMPIFIEGGFSNNNIYTGILSDLFQNCEVMSTELKEATSLGAAICAKCAYESISPSQLDPGLININERVIRKPDINRNLIDRYIESFVSYCKLN